VRGEPPQHPPQHQADAGERDEEDRLLGEAEGGEAEERGGCGQQHAAAEDAPVERARPGRLEPHAQRARNRYRRHREAGEEHFVVGEHLGEQSGDPGDRERAERVGEARQHLDAGEVGIDLGLRPRAAAGVEAGHHGGAHGVRHHLLHDAADHHQELGQHVEPLGRGEGDPSPGGSGEQDEAGGDQARPKTGIGAPLRAEHGDGVDELAHHHLGGPRQLQPHRERGELGRCQRQRLPDPEGVGNGNEAQRAGGEMDRQQR
jgi:hypothetical protein